MDTPLTMKQAPTDPPLGECWCCGPMNDPDRVVYLGNHPEVGICRACARWAAKEAGRSRTVTGPVHLSLYMTVCGPFVDP